MEQLIIIGGGAAGLMSAITAAKSGVHVTILEHMDRIGKKILSTGNGKCNMTNENMDAQKYYGSHSLFVDNIIKKFNCKDAINAFESFGMLTRSRDGYVYPNSEQASTVLDALRTECEEQCVNIVCECNITDITKNGDCFEIVTNKGVYETEYLLLATGGKTFKKTGSDGSGYDLAKKFGHNIIKTVPALTSFICKENHYKAISGVRVKAYIKLVIDGNEIAKETGEVQLTDYGLSGIPIFNVSRFSSYALKNKQNVKVIIDFTPQYKTGEFRQILTGFIQNNEERTISSQLSMILNKKLAVELIRLAKINISTRNKELTMNQIDELLKQIKSYETTVVNVKGFDFAQVTAGGVDTSEVNGNTMESKLCSNLYFAGEIMDIDGICGGYNLQIAWASGTIAAESIVNKIK